MSVDVGAVRAELAAGVLAGLAEQGITDWQPFGFVPEGTPDLPAFIVGVPSEVTFARTFASGTGVMTLPITVVVSLSPDWEEAQRVLDAALGIGVAGSVFDALRWYGLQSPGPQAYSAIRFVNSGNYRQVKDGSATVLAGDLTIEVSV